MREEYLLYCTEREEIAKMSYLRTMVDATLASGINKPEIIKLAFDSYDNYRGLALPYINKESKLNQDSTAKELTIKKMREIHERNKLAFEALKKQRDKEAQEKVINAPTEQLR